MSERTLLGRGLHWALAASTALGTAAFLTSAASFIGLGGSALAAGGAGGTGFVGNTGGAGGTGYTGTFDPSQNGTASTSGSGGGGGGSAGGGAGGRGGGTGADAGGAGGNSSVSGDGAAGGDGTGGGGGGGGQGGFNAYTNTTLNNSGTLTGGNGGAGGDTGNAASAAGAGAGGGGAGGYGAVVTGSGVAGALLGNGNTGAVTGGNGGAGGSRGGGSTFGPAAGGSGGDGGIGVFFSGAYVSLTNSNTGVIKGGTGGDAGVGSTFGRAGLGGAAATFAGIGASLTNSGIMTGGTGGDGGLGTGGTGGAGASFAEAGATLINNATITGGTGGTAASFSTGGTGGSGVSFSGTGGTLINNATITGGNGGASGVGGAGGAGVTGIGLTITNTGTIAGGAGGTRAGGITGTAGNAITFLSGTNVLNYGGTITGNIAIQAAGSTLQINAAVGGSTVANIITGAGRLIQNSANTLTLTGTNTYSGGTAINAGTLSAANAAALGTGAATVAAGATLNVSAVTIGNALTLSGTGVGGVGALTGTGTAGVSGNVTLAANAAVGVAAAADTLTLSGAIGGAGFGLTKVGAGTLVLSGANTYTGATTLTAGTLEARNGAAIADTSRVAFNNAAGTAATFRVTNSETIGSLSGGNASSTVAIAAGQTLTVGGDNTSDGDYAGAITGATGLLVKTGTGTQTLSGALTNGGVQVAQGGLVLSGSLTTAGTAYNGSAPAALVDRGGTAVSVSGTVTATSGAGNEDGVQLNGGSLTVASTGQITAKTRGVSAAAGGTITNAGSITGGGAGIGFQTVGAQTLTVTGAGSITGNSSNGIGGAAMGTGAITLGTLAAPLGNVSGQNAGIGFSGDNNPISIVTNGAITGQSNNGIYVNQPNGTAAIAITQLGGSIASNVGNLAAAASAALYAISGSGPVTISTAGSVTSNNGAAIRVDGTGTNSVTNSGTVQGVIGLRVVGGTTTLANTGTIASTALGGNALQIDSGTLILGERAGTLTGNLNIASTASTLRVDRVADLSLANPITGAGTLDKRGTGTLILTGQSPAFTGATVVNAGVLQVDGLLGSANVTVNNGGTLSGSGKIGDPLINAGGTLAPGSAASIGTLSITGPLTFAPGSFYQVKIMPTANDRTDVTGPTTIQGGTVQVLAGSGTYTPNLRYTLITSTGGVTGRFSSLQTTSNLAFLTPSLSYDANTVYLGFAQTAQITTVASTPNQTGVAAALNGAAPTVTTQVTTTTNPTTGETTTQTRTQVTNVTPAAQVAVAVLNQTSAGAVQALSALSGEIQASAVSAELQTAFVVQEAILDHLRFGESNGFAGPGLGSPGLTGAIGQRFAPGTTLPAMYTADVAGGPAVGRLPVRPVPATYGVWGQAFGSFGSTGGDRNAARLTRQVGGFVLGAETGAGVLGGALSDWRAGVAAGYSFTAFDVTARQSTGQVESGFGAVYARGPLGPLQLRLGAAYAGNALDTRRAVIFPGFSQSVSGKAGGDTVQGFGEVGYRIGFAAGYVEPFVGGAAIHIRRDGFAETGGAAALTVYGHSYDVQTATAGVQGQAVVAELFGGAGPLVARGLVGYRRALGDVVPQALLAFGGGGQAFLTAGVPVARDAVVASAGLDWQVATRTTVGLSYNGQVGARAQDHAVKGSVSYRW